MSSPYQLSFEFFPPKTDVLEAQLWEGVDLLAPFQPQFVSVTYGAGGSTRERTHGIVKKMVEQTSLRPAAHLTCVDASKQDVHEVIEDYLRAGVHHIVALRGDPAQGVGEAYVPHPQGYANAAELVAGIAAHYPQIEMSVSAYPEKHPESTDFETDMAMLKAKWQGGAKRAITQFFFDVKFFEQYLDRVAKAGISIDVLPGIIPIHNFAQVSGFAKRCGTTLPDAFVRRFESLSEPQAQREACIEFACESLEQLRALGVKHFHFYTLNRGALIKDILLQSGLFA